MVYPSGEVETWPDRLAGPGQLGSGWFIHPGKLKPDLEALLGEAEVSSGWFIHPGKLKRGWGWSTGDRIGSRVPDGLSIRGS